jgi:RNA polymerase sigma-70 factor (ECF subfamily)
MQWVGFRSGEQFSAEHVARELAAVRPTIYRIALAVTAHSDLAEDVAQEAALRLLRAPGKWLRADQPDSWMRRVVVRCCLDALTASKRPAQIPIDLVDRRAAESTLDVRLALARLRPDQRAILALDAELGLTDRELAEVLQIPIGTVASRLSAARAAFRAIWEERE